MDDWFNTDSWDFNWGDSSPVEPAPVYDNSSDYSYDNQNYDNYDNQNYDNYDNQNYDNYDQNYSSDNQGYDNGYGGPVQYDDEGNPLPAGVNENGEVVDYNGNVLPQNQGGTPYQYGQQPQYGQQQQRGYGQQQGGYGQQQQRQGGGWFGQGGGNQGGGGFGDILGTLGGLALVGGVGALLGSMLSGKSGGGSVTPGTISMPGSNLPTPQKLATPGINPGYAMGQPVAPVQPNPSTLGQLVNPGAIQTMNPTTLALNPPQ